jgi:hypothetical protein
MNEQRRQLYRAYLLAGAVALVAALGSLLYTERAVVKVSVPPKRLEASLTITGGLTGYALVTKQLDAQATESLKVLTSTLPIPATPAVGYAVFSCSPACPGGFSVPAGTVVATKSGTQYKTQSQVNIPANGPAPPVTISAVVAGPGGNTLSGTVTVIVSHLPSNLHVTNPSAIAGGAEGRKAQVVEQADFDAARLLLTTKVGAELTGQLETQAAGLTYALPGPANITTSSDFNVGDETPAFTVTVSGTARAIGFSASEAEALLHTALTDKVPAGYQLTADPVRTSYRIQAVAPSGKVTITGSSVGYVVPNVKTRALTIQLRGMTLSEARNRLQRSVPNSSVEIRTTPVSMPWLPMFADHIALNVVLEPIPFS